MIIVHRCACGHPDYYHSEHGALCLHCPCRNKTLGAPEILPTWDGAGKLVETIHRPGTKWGGSTNGGIKTCDCGACQALYREQAAAA